MVSKVAMKIVLQGAKKTGQRRETWTDAPVDGFSPNWTIWRKLTPVAGKLA